MAHLSQSAQEMLTDLERQFEVTKDRLVIKDSQDLRQSGIDHLIYNAVFNSDEKIKKLAHWIIWELSQELGCPSSAIQELYEARAHDEYQGITVPAINIRVMTYDVARTVIKAMLKLGSAAFIFEIARSEIGYTAQRPQEYASCILAAAIKEGYTGPVFIQGDHFQISAKKYAADPGKEINAIKDLIDEAVQAGFYNIDIDTSTLVDLAQPTIFEQQRTNFELCAAFTQYIRQRQPQGITISVGGEIGEVGGKNSTLEELAAFMTGYRQTLDQLSGPQTVGISKISIQTGTSHGGVPLPDGTVAKVPLDFGCLERIGKAARTQFRIAGAVQHGASTLPLEAFDRFPQTQTVEIHLATGFQNIIYDSQALPQALKDNIYAHLNQHETAERKPNMTDAQFYYKTRKKGFGPFKKDFWDLPSPVRATLCEELAQNFTTIFTKLGVKESQELVRQRLKIVPSHKKQP